MTDRTAQLTTLFFGPVILGLLWFGSPYIFPLTNPSDAVLAESGSISIDTFIEGKRVELNWSINLDSPKSFFRGIESVSLYGRNKEFTVFLHLPLNKSPSSASAEVYVNKIGAGDFISQFPQKNPLILNIKNYGQSLKKFKLSTSIELPKMNLQFQKEEWHLNDYEPITLEIRSGQIDIDSAVLYKWSPKGGASYYL